MQKKSLNFKKKDVKNEPYPTLFAHNSVDNFFYPSNKNHLNKIFILFSSKVREAFPILVFINVTFPLCSLVYLPRL